MLVGADTDNRHTEIIQTQLDMSDEDGLVTEVSDIFLIDDIQKEAANMRNGIERKLGQRKSSKRFLQHVR